MNRFITSLITSTIDLFLVNKYGLVNLLTNHWFANFLAEQTSAKQLTWNPKAKSAKQLILECGPVLATPLLEDSLDLGSHLRDLFYLPIDRALVRLEVEKLVPVVH